MAYCYGLYKLLLKSVRIKNTEQCWRLSCTSERSAVPVSQLRANKDEWSLSLPEVGDARLALLL